jgi:pyruvate dehydrogenase E2 component (dihydrolipoyllysine-residue acetyltransferase)
MTNIQMPQLGETIVEGTILKWLKQEGENVERDEPLFEISTDKVDTEVPSPVAGTISKILVQEGQTVPVGTDLAQIETGDAARAAKEAPEESTPESDEESAEAVDQGSAPDSPAAEPASPAATSSGVATSTTSPAQQPAAAAVMSDRGPRSQILSPVVRRLAAEHSLDLSLVRGTGTGGRITRSDVESFIASGGGAAPPAAASALAPGAAPSGAAAAPAPAEAPPGLGAVQQPAPSPAAAGAGEEIVPMTHIRKAIAEHMATSVQTTARAWTMVEVNVENLVRLRQRAKDSFFEKYGVKLTYLPFVVRATIDALLAFPMVNARLSGDDIVLHKYVNMGIAVSYDAGLIVPVIRGADGMNTVGIARAIADLAARARAHQLRPDEVQGATFTITNPGPYGSLLSVPIINQPNTGILSLDGIQKRPVVLDDSIAIRNMVYVSMSWDHRVIDGELATQFLARVKQNLETWDFAEDLGL